MPDEANCSKLSLTCLGINILPSNTSDNSINIDSLHKLNLSNNSLTNSCLFLFTSLAGLPNLTLLNLSSNKLEGIIVPPKNSKLLVLNLSHNELTGFSDSFPPSLKALVVTHNKLTEIPAGLKSLSELNNLMLSYNEITECELERFGTLF
jgi:leucine-rich repeat protein SHOC2